MIHVNEIKFNGDSKFEQQFNICSDLFQKSFNENLPESERDKFWDQYMIERWRIETGSY